MRHIRSLQPPATVSEPHMSNYNYSVSSRYPGADARTFLSTLSTVIQSGIQVLIWAGDAGKTPTFRPCTRSPMHGSVSPHRLGLQHRWCAGRRLPAAVRPIGRI